MKQSHRAQFQVSVELLKEVLRLPTSTSITFVEANEPDWVKEITIYIYDEQLLPECPEGEISPTVSPVVEEEGVTHYVPSRRMS